MQILSHRLLARHEEFEIELTLGAEDIRRYTWEPAVLDPVFEAEL